MPTGSRRWIFFRTNSAFSIVIVVLVRQVEVLHDRRQVAPQVAVFVDVADDLLSEQVVFFVEVQEGELFEQAVVERNRIREGELVALFIVERLPGLEARRDRRSCSRRSCTCLPLASLTSSVLFPAVLRMAASSLRFLLEDFLFFFKALFKERIHFELRLDLLFESEGRKLQHLQVLHLLRRQLHHHLMLQSDIQHGTGTPPARFIRLISGGGACSQEFVIPGLAIAADERLFQEFSKPEVFLAAAFSASRTLFDFNVTEEIAPHGVNADREQVAGDRLAKGYHPFLPGALETALGNAVVKVDEHAFLLVDAGRGVVSGMPVHEARCLNRLDTLCAEIPPDDRVGLLNLFRTSSSLSGAPRPPEMQQQAPLQTRRSQQKET